MIIGTLKHIETYKDISENIYVGLNFLVNAKPNIELGVYPLNNLTKAIVSEYRTIENFELGYEAHRYVIDIQYPIIGLERVKWSPIDGMKINIPYDQNNDRTYYKDPLSQGTYVDIGNDFFVIMFPEDGHSPQHYITKPEMIKKITIKVSL